jgi:hypothetical protein
MIVVSAIATRQPNGSAYLIFCSEELDFRSMHVSMHISWMKDMNKAMAEATRNYMQWLIVL